MPGGTEHTLTRSVKMEDICHLNKLNANVIAPARRPHLVQFYFSPERPERRDYIVVGVDDRVHSSDL